MPDFWLAIISILLLRGDSFALPAFGFLASLFIGAIFGPSLIKGADVSMKLGMRYATPSLIENGFGYILGAESLGRPILLRILLGPARQWPSHSASRCFRW